MDERQQHDHQQTQQFPQPAAWGAPPPTQDTPAYYPPPMIPQTKARPKWKTPLIAGVTFVLGTAIGAAAAGGSKNNSPSTASGSTAPTGAGASSAAAPATSAAASATSAAAPPAPAKSVVLTVSGSGIKTTKQFTVADNWSLKYTYDCSSFGSQGNFQVTEQGGDKDGLPLANELGNKGSDVTYQHSDAGQHSLEVNSECAWTMTVTSGDAG